MLKTDTLVKRTEGKIFIHDLFPQENVVRTEIDGVRHYITPTGEAYRSVTTILGENTDKSGLDKWRQKVGEEEANRITRQAGIRGTAVHDLAEKYVLNLAQWARSAMPINIEMFNKARRVLDTHVDKIYGIEHFLYSHDLKTAGATDLIADFDGIMSIIDFKTSRRLKEESYIENYFIQATCYAMMAEERLGITVPQIVIIIMVDDEPEPQVFKKYKSLYTKRVKEVFT